MAITDLIKQGKRDTAQANDKPDAGKIAPEGVRPEDHAVHTPHARDAEPLEEDEKFDQLADKEKAAESRQEALLDEGLEESFPGSDPVSVKRIT